MALGQIYTTGTVTVTNGSATVTGAGVIWTDVIDGDTLQVGTTQAFVLSVNTALDQLTLKAPWAGTSAAGAAYMILKNSWLRYDPAITQTVLREFLTKIAGAGIIYAVTGETPDPGVGKDGDYALKTNETPWTMWLKVAGVWEEQDPSGGAAASGVTFTPAGNIAATDVQAAIAELDAEKVAKAGDTMTGTLIINPTNPGGFVLDKVGDRDNPIVGKRNAVNRWQLNLGSGYAETATDGIGSDFILSRHHNSGAWWDDSFVISRLDGLVRISGDPTVPLGVATKQYVDAHAAAAAPVSASQGRLTLASGVPVMTTTQSAKTTIFYTPYIGASLPIFNGTTITMTEFTELSVATTDTTKSPAAIGASKVNDWFVWNDSGTIRLGHGPDWTNDTTRSAGTALVMVNGILLNNASITNGPAAQRGTYVGTTRSNASSQLDWIIGTAALTGGASFFGVWNCYNRVGVTSAVGDTTASWTYSTNAWRNANGSANFRHQFVVGLASDGLMALYQVSVSTSSNTVQVSLGFDSSTPVATSVVSNGASGSLGPIPLLGTASVSPGIGFHFIQAIENCIPATGTNTFYGVSGGIQQNGLFFNMRM